MFRAIVFLVILTFVSSKLQRPDYWMSPLQRAPSRGDRPLPTNSRSNGIVDAYHSVLQESKYLVIYNHGEVVSCR